MYKIGTGLDVGIKRRGKPNQDSIGVFSPGLFNRKPVLIVVADGMGGHRGGAEASKLVVKSIAMTYKSANKDESKQSILIRAVQKAQAAVVRRAKSDPKLQAMGSTVVAGILEQDLLSICNVGDSRAYVINESQVRQVSVDHSVVAMQLAHGLITEEEARNHPKRSHLTMSISARRDEVDPYYGQILLGEDEVVLLCSDGLWGVVSEKQLQTVVLELEPQAAADKLVNMAKMNQGPDNISVIVARKSDFKPLPISEE